MRSTTLDIHYLSMAAALFCAAAGGCGDDPKPSPARSTAVADDAASDVAVTDEKVAPHIEAAPSTDLGIPNSSEIKSPAPASPTPQPIFRKSDTRPPHDDKKLAAAGIHAYESKRLKLYTDIDPKTAAKIPELIDAAYIAWEEYFGKLPPNRERTEFQITGYLMKDKALFRDAGLIPADLREFVNGRHRGAEFWMNDQTYDYYRRHLVIHESTHCFMEAIAGERYFEELPAWYWEGMAELFGTHRIDQKGDLEFRVMPTDKEGFAGLGRITIVREEIEAGKLKSVVDVSSVKPGDFLGNDAYAWSWALCEFLDTHPIYQKQFRKLGSLLTGSRFSQAWRQLYFRHQFRLPAEWKLFVEGLQYGYDIERAAIEFRIGEPVVDASDSGEVKIRADRGWQSSAVHVEKGKTYTITAAGRFTLAQKPKPWVSDAGGISFDYFSGRPLGLLLARIQTDQGEMLPIRSVGTGHKFSSPASGTLFFRLNDSWSLLADNTGEVTVSVRQLAASTGE